MFLCSKLQKQEMKHQTMKIFGFITKKSEFEQETSGCHSQTHLVYVHRHLIKQFLEDGGQRIFIQKFDEITHLAMSCQGATSLYNFERKPTLQ